MMLPAYFLGERIITARLVVRGFKDLQAAQLSTFAGTTTRWGQRMVNSVAAQHGWPLFVADVSQAFLRGLTFEQAAQLKDEVSRDVQFTVPPGSASILKRLPGYQDFNPLTEVLRMLRCGFGLACGTRSSAKSYRTSDSRHCSPIHNYTCGTHPTARAELQLLPKP